MSRCFEIASLPTTSEKLRGTYFAFKLLLQILEEESSFTPQYMSSFSSLILSYCSDPKFHKDTDSDASE